MSKPIYKEAVLPSPVKKLTWDKKIYLLLIGLVLASGIKLIIESWVDAPLPPESFPEIGGDFTLTSANGPVSLHDFKGKVVLLSFGYANCPDVCPTTLSNIAAALRLLRQSEDLDHVQTLFVTLDYERDTAEQIANFTEYFHASMVGLHGNKEEIEKIANQYKVGYQKQDLDSKLGYTITHLSYIYVIRPDNNIGELLSYTSPPKEIVKAVRHWLPWSQS